MQRKYPKIIVEKELKGKIKYYDNNFRVFKLFRFN